MPLIRVKETGDTIVEVLIAMAVLALVLAGAFVSARQSATATRRSQERVEGLKVAEEQIELLKTLVVLETAALKDPSASNFFCIALDGTRQGTTALPAVDADTFQNTHYHTTDPVPAKVCPRQPAGGISYFPAIERNLSTNIFTVRVRWERAGGGGNEELTIAYKVHL